MSIPPKGEPGETSFGFTIGQETKVVKGKDFLGYPGTVWSFEGGCLVRLELGEGPNGHKPWAKTALFEPDQLQPACPQP